MIVGARLLTPRNIAPPCQVFKIEDSETHYVTARHEQHAVDVLCEAMEIDRAEFVDQGYEIERVAPETLIRYRPDIVAPEVQVPGDLPKGAWVEVSVQVAAYAWQYIERGTHGLICSTVY